MSRIATITVRVGGALSDFVAANFSEYTCDLIRRDRDGVESEAFGRLDAELIHAFAAPNGSYQPLTTAQVIVCDRIAGIRTQTYR